MASGPQLAALHEAVDPDAVHLSIGAASCPADTEVCVLDPNLLPDDLQGLASLPALRALILPYAGLLPKHLDPLRAAFGERLGTSVQLHNVHHNAALTAEMAVALLLAAAKLLVPADRRLREGDWRPRGYPYPGRVERPMAMVGLEEQTALVLGLGAVGLRVSRACTALGMRVVGVRRTAAPGGEQLEGGLEVHPPSELHRLLPGAAALLVCVPSTAETAALVGAAELGLLPSRAVLVNVARGGVVDERALYEALAARRLHAAGLDVWWSYPASYAQACSMPPSAYPFHELENVVMSPHRGGGVGTPDLEVLRMRHVGRALTEAGRGGVEQMSHRWDFARGY